MDVLLIHASDRAAQADAFAAVVMEQRGAFEIVRLDERATTLPASLHISAVMLLWSRGLDPFPQGLDRVALEAWAEDRLLLITLDDSERPLGLRDLPVIEASGSNQKRRITDAATAFRDAITVGMRDGFPGFVRREVIDKATPTFAVSEPAWWEGGPAAVVSRLFRHAKRILREWIGGRADVILPPTPLAEPLARDVFVSYAHADIQRIDPVVAVVEAAGKTIWIDRKAIQTGDSWAGEIVRAIKAARGILVMCSRQSFRSDHVKREVYLADKYKKPIVPVFVEPVEPPDDFEYFLAGLQRLDWYAAPSADRRAALTAAVARF
jgi:hypothetical protein